MPVPGSPFILAGLRTFPGRAGHRTMGEASRWVSYDEAAVLLGMPAEAVKRLALRQSWPRRPSPAGGTLVAVPEAISDEVTDHIAPRAKTRSSNNRDRGFDLRPNLRNIQTPENRLYYNNAGLQIYVDATIVYRETFKMADQIDWRFCHKCEALFFDGFPGKGVCAAGGAHEAQGFNFIMPHDNPETPQAQSQWRFCHKCEVMFFNGFPNKGVCKAGGAHDAAGFNFVPAHDIPGSPTAQDQWRFCHKCNAMFFNGFPSKGACPAGGAHDAAGFNFVLPHIDEDTAVFDSGVTSPLPLGGSVHVVMRRSGDFTFSCHAHDSGFDNISYVMSAVVISSSGIAFTFQHAGHVEGTSAGLPFGTPNRNSDFTNTGNNPMITREFDALRAGARILPSLNGQDKLIGGLEGAIGDLLSQAAAALGKAAVGAAVALVAA